MALAASERNLGALGASRCTAETTAVVNDNWQAVLRVTGALSEHHRLTQAELGSRGE